MPSIPAVRYDNRPTGGGGLPFPTTLEVNWHIGNVISGDPVYSVNYQNPNAADGDTIEWSIEMLPGTYTLTVVGEGSSTQGIQDFYLDGNLIGTKDWYTPSFTTGVTLVVPITLVNSSSTLRAVMNGQNASSSGFFYSINHMTIA